MLKSRNELIQIFLLVGIMDVGIKSLVDKNDIVCCYWWCFLVMGLTLAVGVMTVIMIHHQPAGKNYWGINIAALGQIIKTTVILYYIFIHLVQQEIDYKGGSIYYQGELIDLMVVLLITAVIRFKLEKCQGSFPALMCYIMVCSICLLLKEAVIDVLVILTGYIMLMIWCYILINRKKSENLMAGQPIPGFKGYVIITICMYIVGLTLGDNWRYSYISECILCCIQNGYIFWSAYKVNIESPWMEQVAAMKDASEKISVQHKYCEDIVSLSHELKTPVNVIKSALTILNMDFKGKDIHDQIYRAKEECSSIMSIIQDMIDLQRLYSGYTKLTFKQYNMVELMENVVDGFCSEGYSGRIIFDPIAEEIYNKADIVSFQQAFTLLIGCLLSQERENHLFIKVNENLKRQEIEVVISSSSETLIWLGEKEKINKNIQMYLVYQFISLVLQIHQASFYLIQGEKETDLHIIFRQDVAGSPGQCRKDNIEIIKEHIRCRYKID